MKALLKDLAALGAVIVFLGGAGTVLTVYAEGRQIAQATKLPDGYAAPRGCASCVSLASVEAPR